MSRSPLSQLKAAVRKRGGALMGSVTSTTSPDIVLTFDDGPDPEQTPRILEVLRRRHATATFFVLMSRVTAFPRELAEIQAAGHEIALHGVNHQAITRFSGRTAFHRTADAKAALEDAISAEVRWFRPPYGRQNPTTWRAVRRAGLTPVLWNGSTGDSQPMAEDARWEKSMCAGRAGAIVLAHDGIAGPRDGVGDPEPPLQDRASHVDRVLKEWSSNDLRAVSLERAIADGATLNETLEMTQFGRERDPRFL